MRSFFQKLCSKRLLPATWTILTIVLLCLPGSSFSGGAAVFSIPHVDKVVHVILFGGIVLFWGGYYAFQSDKAPGWRRVVIFLAILSTALGIALEYVQFYCIPQRSFDRFDIVADTAGAVAASLFLLFLFPGRQTKD